MNLRGLKTALHMLVAAAVTIGSLTLVPSSAEAAQLPVPAKVCNTTTCTITFAAGGFYVYSPPRGATVTLSANGGAGGYGGSDTYGGGAPLLGSRITYTFTSDGTALSIYPGGQAGSGSSNVCGTGGGAGGVSHFPNGDYAGGKGSDAGSTCSSGAGGGGGAATVVKFGNEVTPSLVAGGGGGASGGNQFSSGSNGKPVTAGYTNGTNTVGGTNEIYNNIYPSNPQALSTDGSGAGGGGGGVVGGAAGVYVKTTETLGTPGYTGSSTAPSGATIVENGSTTWPGQVVISYANSLATIVGPNTISAAPITFNVTLPAAPTPALTASMFAIDNTATTATGCNAPSALTGSGTSYTITVTGCSLGNVSLKLNSGSVTINGGSNIESFSNLVSIEQTPPTFTITPPTSPTSSSSISFSVIPNEELTNSSVSTSDFTVTGAGCSVSGVTAPTAPAISPFVVNVTGCATSQNVALTLKSSVVADAAGNVGPVAWVTSSSILTDYVAPSGSWVTPTSNTTNLPTLYFTFLTTEPIAPSSLAAADFTNTGTATGCVFTPNTAGQTITLTVTGCAAGTVIPRITANSVTDIAGNAGPAAAITGPTVTRDVTVPTATIVAAPATTPTNAAVLNYNITFSKSVSGLTAADLTNAGTSAGCVFVPVLAANGLSATLAANFCADGTVIPTLAANSLVDAAGNLAPASSAAPAAITIDRTLATVTGFTTAVTSPTNSASSIAFNLTFSESVSGLTGADFTNAGTATGCTFGVNLASGTAMILYANNCSTSGTLKPVLAASSVVDSAANASPTAAVNGPQLTLDRIAPVVVAGEFPDENIATFTPLTYTFTFSEPIVDTTLTAADFSNSATSQVATGCVYAPVVAADRLSATVTVTGCSEGNIKLRLAANAVTDAAGNTGPAALIDSPVTSLINTAPRVTFTTVPAALTNATTLTYTATFSEYVTGVSANAFTVSGTATGCILNSSVTNLASSVPATTLTITGCSEGTVIVTARANVLTDSSTALRPGPETRVNAATVTIDRTAPTATFTPITPVVSPTGVASQTFKLNFSEAIDPTSLVAGDFSNVGAATAATGCVFTPTVAANGLSADVVVTGCGTGNLLAQLSASAFKDVAGNNSVATAVKLADSATPSTPITIVMDRTIPTATLVASPATTPTAGPNLTYNLTFSEAVTGLAAADFSNTGTATDCVFTPATATPAASTAVVVTVSGCTSGTVILNLAANGVTDLVGATGPAAAVVATSITLDVNGPAVNGMATSFAGALTSATNVTFTTQFDQATSNIAGTDFENAGTATGCTFTPAAATVVANANLSTTVTCTGEGTLIPRLKASSVTDAVGNTGPASAFTLTGSIVFDNSAPTATITTTSPALTNASSLTFTVTFSDSVTGIAAADFSNSATSSAATGCVFVPSATNGTSVTVTVNSCSAGNVVLKLAANGVTNLSAQTGPTGAAESTQITIERTAPTAMVVAPASPNNSLTQVFQLSFGESVTGLTLDDLAITGVTGCVPALTNITATGATLTLTSCATGLLRVALKPDAVVDAYGNLGPVSEVVTEVGLDRTVPVVSITAPASPTNSATLTYSVVVSEPLADGTLNASDFVVSGTGCAVGTLTAPSSGFSPYSITVTGCADTSIADLSLPARTISDLAGNIGPTTSVNPDHVVVDRVKPGSTITSSFPAVTNATIISYTIVTNEAINPASVVAADFANAASAPVATGCVYSPYVVGKTITVTITGCSEGNVVLKQLADSMIDTAGNTGPAAIVTGPAIKIDRTVPTETLVAASTTTPSSATSFTYNATFPEAISGLTSADFSNTGTATGCVFTPTTAVNGLSASVVITGCSEGTLIVNQAAGSVTDVAGNAGPASAIVMSSITIDRTAATATITTSVTSPTNATSIAYTVTFSETVTGIAAADFSNGGTATGCVFTPSAASGTTITLTVTSCATSGTLKPVLAQGGVNDAALTASPTAAVNGPELTLDRIAPVVTAGTVPAASVTTIPVSLVYTYSFAEPIVESTLVSADFSNTATATACVITPVVAADRLSATVTVTNCSDGTVKLRLAANALTDVAGNTGPAALIDSTVTTTVNTVPRVSFTTSPGASSNLATLNYVATFSESVVGVTASDFAVTGTATDCVLNLTAPANATTATTSASFTITGCSPGTVIVTMPVGSVTEAATQTSGPTTALVSTTTIDRTVATATIAPLGVITSPTGLATMNFKLTFSEAIKADTLTAADITNGAAAFVDPITGVVTPTASCTYGTPVVAADGLSATVAVTNCSSGLLNPKLGSGQVTDLAGNPSPASTVKLATAILVDRSVATATLVPVSSSSPTNAATVDYTLTFNESVSGLTASDFTNTGTATGCTFAVTGSGSSYTVTVAACGSGTLVPTLAVNSVTDLLLVDAPAAVVSASSLTVDKTAPTATLATNRPNGAARSWAHTITLTLSEAIQASSLTVDDFENIGTATGCTYSAVSYTAGATTATATIAANTCTEGSVITRLKANSLLDIAGNAGPTSPVEVTTPSYISDGGVPTATWTATPATPSNGSNLNFTLTMSDWVSGFAAGNFSNAIASGSGGATGCVFTPSATVGLVITVAVTGCSTGALAVKLAANQVYEVYGVYGPAAAVTSSTVNIDRAPATATITSVYGSQASNPKFVVDFSEPISGLTIADFAVLGDSACVPTITSQTATKAEVSVANCRAGNTIRLTLAGGSVLDIVSNPSPVTTVSSEPVLVLLAEQSPLVVTTNKASILFGSSTEVKASVPAAGTAGGGSGTGAVTYATSTPLICSINPTTGVITQIAIGDCMVSATRAQDATYLAATSAEVKVRLTRQPQLPLVGVGTPSVTTYNPSLSPQTVAITTTGGSGAGAVTAVVNASSSDVCSIDGMTVTFHIPGACLVDLTKSGGNLYDDATASVTVTMVPGEQASLIPIASATSMPWDSENPVVVSVPSSGVGSGSGIGLVTFSSTTPDVCDVDATSGEILAVVPAAIGTCSIVAAKAGDEFFNAKYSDPISITFTKGTQDPLVIESDDTEGLVADQITVSVSDLDVENGSGLGAVTFAISLASAEFCSINPVTGVITGKKPGACVVTATKAGDDLYNALTSASITIDIVKAPQEILFAPIAQLFNGGKAVVPGTGKPFAITAVTTSGIAPTFVSLTPAVCTVSGVTATPKALGVCRVTASAAGNESYFAASDVTREIPILEKPIPQILDHTPMARISLAAADSTIAATLKSVLTVGTLAVNNFVTPVLAIDKSSVKNCSIVAGKLHGLSVGPCVYTLASPAVGAFTALAPVKFTTTFFAGDNVTTQTYPTVVASEPRSIGMTSNLIPLLGVSSANQPVSYSTTDANVCWADADGFLHLAGAGVCTFSAVSGGGAYTLSTSAPLSFTVVKATQVATFVAPGEVIPGSSPVKRAAEATDNPAGFPLQYSLNSGLTPVFTSLDPDNCLVDPDGTVTWQVDVKSTPTKNTCRITVAEPGNSAYNALPLETLTITAKPSTVPYVPGTPIAEKPVNASLPRTGGKASAGPDTFAVTVKNNTVEVQPFSRGLYIGPITATVTVPYKVQVAGVWIDKSQTCTTKFGVQKAIAANKNPMALKQFTNSMKCALNKDAFAWFKAGNSLDITAKVLRTRLYPTTLKAFDPKLKRPIAPKTVTWHLQVG